MSNPFSFSHEDEEEDFGGALEGGSPKNSRSRNPRPRPEAVPVTGPARHKPAGKPVGSAPAGKPVGSTPTAKPAPQKRSPAPARQQQPKRAPAPRREGPAASAPSPSAPRRTSSSLPSGTAGGLPVGAGTGYSRLSPPSEARTPARQLPPTRDPEPEVYEPDHGFEEDQYQDDQYQDDRYDDSSDDSYDSLEASFQQQQQREDTLARNREEHHRKVERQRQRDLEREEREEEEEEFDPKSKGRKKSKSKKQKQSAKDKKALNRGGRGRMLAVRYSIIGMGVILMGFGVKSIVFPPDIPPDDVLAANIQAEMNMSAFPADQAESFVLGFTRAYLNYDPALSSQRDADLEHFAADSISVNGLTVPADSPQTVVEGPYISGVRYVDDNNALFTTTAKLDNGRWVSIATPVFYDDNVRAFVVAQAPSLAPNPQLSASAGQPAAVPEVDQEATESATAAVTSFMTAWGASDSEAISVVASDEADPRVWNGLEGNVKFDRADLIEVYEQPEDESSSVWEAKVTVAWDVVNTPQDDEVVEEEPTNTDETSQYMGSYQLILQRSDDGKWYVADIIPEQYKGTPDPNAGQAAEEEVDPGV